MTSEERLEYIRYRLERADDTYEDALFLIEKEKWNSAVNRLYICSVLCRNSTLS